MSAPTSTMDEIRALELFGPSSACGCVLEESMVGGHGWHWLAENPSAPQTWVAWERCPAYQAAVKRSKK